MTPDTDHHLTDPALREVAVALDALAKADAGDPSLNDRIAAGTLPLLQAPPLRLTGATEKPRRVWAITPLRLAACFGLVATAALTWLAANPPRTTPNLAATNPGEEWAILSVVFDDSTRSELDDIASATSEIRSTIDAWGLSDLLEEGAM